MEGEQAFHQVFKHWIQYQVIFCPRCRFCPRPQHIERHLADQHAEISIAVRRQIAQHVRQMSHVAQQPEEVRWPQPEDPVIDQLPQYSDGFRCLGTTAESQPCLFVVRNRRGIQEHCKQEHQWQNAQQRGGRSRQKQKQTPNAMWAEDQCCQQFFREGQGWKRYFVVTNPRDIAAMPSPHRDLLVLMRREREQQAERIKQHQEEQQVQGQDRRYEANAWLERVGWRSHLTVYTYQELQEFAQLPIRELDLQSRLRSRSRTHSRSRSRSRSRRSMSRLSSVVDDESDEDEGELGPLVEPALWYACQSTHRIIRQAQQASHPHVVGIHTLQYINRREVGQANNEKPFYGRQMGKTITKYSHSWARILCYIWRTYEDEDRTPYRLTERQRTCLDALVTQADQRVQRGRTATAQQLDDACLAWWIALLDHPIIEHEYENAMLSGLAVLGWNGELQHWRSPKTYTPILSAMVTVARMLVIYQAFVVREKHIAELQEQGHSRLEAARASPTTYTLVQEMVGRFMTLAQYDGQPSPMSWILQTRTIGLKIRYNTPEEGMITWHRDQIQCGSTRFSMAQLRGMIHGLVHETRQILYADLMLLDMHPDGSVDTRRTPLPPATLHDWVDNPSNFQKDGNFLTDRRNVFPVDGQVWLLDRVASEPPLMRRFLESPSSTTTTTHPVVGVPWRHSSISQYFERVKKCKQWLYACVHMTNGGPWRGTEGLTAEFRNSADSAGRGVFLSQGMVEFVVGYSKGYGKSASPKIIHRFVPEEVGLLVVYFIWLVQPFVQHLQHVQHQQCEFSPYLWEPDHTAGQADDEADEWADQASQGEDDGSEADDQFAEEFAVPSHELHPPGTGEAEEQPALDEVPVVGFTTRVSTQIARQVAHVLPPSSSPLNVDGFWNSSKVRTTLQQASLRGMGCSVSISVWRHMVKAIIREYSQDRRVLDALNDEHGLGVGPLEDKRNEQFGHGSRIAGMIYGRDIMEHPQHSISDREQFRRISIEWHRFLQFASTREMDQGSMGIMRFPEVGMTPEARDQQHRRWRALHQSRLAAGLSQLLQQPQARFRGRQEEVLQAIVRRESPIVAVMGTSVGKSVCFMLPAVMDRVGMTIVVVPLVSLRDNMLDRCTRAHIRCAEWHPQRQPDHAQIVLITPESTVSEAFHQFMNRQRAMGVLDRIVVDECHVVLESVDGWRPKVLALRQLVQHQTQLVYLTATLQPREEERFYRQMGLSGPSVRMIRDRTSRCNIAYSVTPYHREQEDEAVRLLVEQKKQQYPLPGQIIIYCASVAQTESLAQLLGCSAYHRHVGDVEFKRDVLHRFISGQEQVFTATNALGLGIDRASVRVVIHVGVPRQMRSYAQESGRAGRDGLPSEAIIMQSAYRDRRGKAQAIWPDQIEESMRSFVTGTVCRRVVLDLHMDGHQQRIACETEEEACDVCQRRRVSRMDDSPDGTAPLTIPPTVNARQDVDHDEFEDAEVEDDVSIEEEAEEDDYEHEQEYAETSDSDDTTEQEPEEEHGHTDQEENEEEGRQESQHKRARRGTIRVEAPLSAAAPPKSPVLGSPMTDAIPIRDQEQQAEVGQFVAMQQIADGQVRIDALHEMFQRWQYQCAACMTSGSADYQHPSHECKRSDRACQIDRQSREIKNQIKYKEYAACFLCGWPQSWCGRWATRSGGGYRMIPKAECSHERHFHVWLVVAVIQFGEEAWVQQIEQWQQEQDDRIPGGGIALSQPSAARLDWMGRKIRWHGIQTSELVRLFYRCGLIMERIRV